MRSILTKGGNIELVERFQRLAVKFLVAGGAAVFVHGCREPLEVDDLDLLIEPSIQNCDRVILALTESM